MERQESCAVRCRELLRQLVAFMFTNVGVIGLVVGYMIAGAFMFGAIEGGEALDRSGHVLRLRARAADRLWNVTCCRYNIFNRTAWFHTVSKELLAYQEDIIRAVRSGWDGIDETETSKQWSFSGSFLYSLTVITTIGYGNISPRTVWGKVTTILYAIIGMPLFLLYLSNIGDVLARSFKWTYAMLCLCRGCPGVARRRAARRRGLPLDRQPSFQQWYEATGGGAWSGEPEPEDEWSETYDPQAVTVPITLCVVIMVGYMVFGATVFAKWEKWDALDGSYFCFISLSSIGFGDIVPGDQIYAAQKIEASFIVCSVYLLLGMALIAMCFNLMQEQVMHHIAAVKRALRRIVRCKR